MIQQSNEHAPYPQYVPAKPSDTRSCPDSNPDYRVHIAGKAGWCKECCNFVDNKCTIHKLPVNE
jgi:hypothetical protein